MYAPFLSKVAAAVDIRACGSLGTRVVRKQVQALIHFAMGNTKMRINANSLVPSTAALVVSASVGAGKNLYHTLFEDVITMLATATASLDRQIFDSVQMAEESVMQTQESVDMMISGLGEKSKKKYEPSAS